MNYNKSAMGILFPNSYDALIPELTTLRLMASVPFASRYRMIDFVLSDMSRSGMDDIYVMCNKNYHSLVDHLGSGREWDLVRKQGGLQVFPPYSLGNAKPYTGRVDALASVLDHLRKQKQKYVIISDTNFAANIDFKKMLDAHIASGADVTIAYHEEALTQETLDSTSNNLGYWYSFDIDNGRIKNIFVNLREDGVQNVSLNVYIMERELLISLINMASVRGMVHLERDVLLPRLTELNVQAYKFDGYVAKITGLRSYFRENLRLLEDGNLEALFQGNSIYTKIRDDNPTRYETGCSVRNIMAADGCVIEGEVDTSVLFRGVKVAAGAKVKNCVVMQDTVIESGAEIEYVITDKDVVITAGTKLSGSENYPIYISKGRKV